MRCRECNQAFNGADGLCPFCGLVHAEESLTNIPKVEKEPVPVKEEKPEVKQPEKKVIETKTQPKKPEKKK